jgi:type I restriction-modification system DNA methylase subunit
MTNLELFETNGNAQSLTLEATANALGVSVATVNNWLKLGVLVRAENAKKKAVSKSSVDELKAKIDLGDSEKLQKRANKKFTSKKRVHTELNNEEITKFLNYIDGYTQNHTIDELLISTAIALLENESKNSKKNDKQQWIEKLNDEIVGWTKESKARNLITSSLKNYPIPNTVDLLGKLYQHLSASSAKAMGGVFYTQKSISNLVVNELAKKDETVLDPCCGSGSFLIEALLKKIKDKETNPLKNIFGTDLDKRAIHICRINLLLIAQAEYVGDLHIHNNDGIKTLLAKDFEGFPSKFQFIATNPPWGADIELSEVEMNRVKNYASDSFSIFLALAIDRLAEGGRLSYLLPESFVDVGKHSPVRKKLLSETSNIKINHLGKVFKGLLTNVVNISLNKLPPTKKEKVHLLSNGNSFAVSQSDVLKESDSTFIFGVSAEATIILNKIYAYKHKSLKDDTKYALGIVTGNNAKLISQTKLNGYEVILRGKDISPYQITEAEQYIKFDKKSFQQCADEAFFRASEKLIYRFIADRFMFAYDNKQRLTLNSANLLIPNIGIPIKVVLGILQSEVIRFVFNVKFNSIKILRKHIEAMPIFVFDKSVNDNIVKIVDELIKPNQTKSESLIREIDALIYKEIGLDKAEIEEIKKLLYESKS